MKVVGKRCSLLMPSIIGYLLVVTIINADVYFKYTVPTDILCPYIAGRMVREGGNPYCDADLKKAWSVFSQSNAVRQEERDYSPGFPAPFLYPPNALVFFSFLSMLPWQVVSLSVPLFLTLFVLLSGVIIWLVPGKRDLGMLAVSVLAVAGLNGIAWVIRTGNPTGLALFFLALFYYYFIKDKKVFSGLLLGLSAIKPTLCLPLFVFLCLKREWRIVAFAGTIALLPVLCLLMYDYHYGCTLIASWLKTAAQWDRFLFALYPGSGLWQGQEIWPANGAMLDYMTAIGPLLSFYGHVLGADPSYTQVKVAVALIIGIMGLAVLYYDHKAKLPCEHLIVLLFGIEFLLNYHLFYDYCAIVCFLIASLALIDRRGYLPLIIVSSLFYLPFNGLLCKMGIPKQFYLWIFSMPVAVMGTMVIVALFSRKLVVIGSTPETGKGPLPKARQAGSPDHMKG
jgi:hypothetical protein